MAPARLTETDSTTRREGCAMNNTSLSQNSKIKHTSHLNELVGRRVLELVLCGEPRASTCGFQNCCVLKKKNTRPLVQFKAYLEQRVNRHLNHVGRNGKCYEKGQMGQSEVYE